MTTREKLAAILAAIQVDSGNRGLSPLFQAVRDDFAAACECLASVEKPRVAIATGFYIPTGHPPAFETDGPLGAYFLLRALQACSISATIVAEQPILSLIETLEEHSGRNPQAVVSPAGRYTHLVAIERSGPAIDCQHYSMRGFEITEYHDNRQLEGILNDADCLTIGIGDGGNEIGMGKLPHSLIAEAIPRGDRIHCRVPTDYLIVAGVSNWGAYALAAGLFVLRGQTPPWHLFDADCEWTLLQRMVQEGPLVDGVSGLTTATVDGLSWDAYIQPLIRIREILRS